MKKVSSCTRNLAKFIKSEIIGCKRHQILLVHVFNGKSIQKTELHKEEDNIFFVLHYITNDFLRIMEKLRRLDKTKKGPIKRYTFCDCKKCKNLKLELKGSDLFLLVMEFLFEIMEHLVERFCNFALKNNIKYIYTMPKKMFKMEDEIFLIEYLINIQAEFLNHIDKLKKWLVNKKKEQKREKKKAFQKYMKERQEKLRLKKRLKKAKKLYVSKQCKRKITKKCIGSCCKCRYKIMEGECHVIVCCNERDQHCLVELHQHCWKTFARSHRNKCPTPDCEGNVKTIKIWDCYGNEKVKCINTKSK